MLKAVKIKLYPNKTQKVYINKLLGCYRFVYNQCLDKKIKEYTNNRTSLGLKELGNYFHQDLTKNEDHTWLNEHNTKVLKQSVITLLDAYKRFFVNNMGFPRFKSKNDKRQSCRFPVEAISSRNNYENNRISLTKQIKDIKFKTSDKNKKYLEKYKQGIKSATLTKTKSGECYLSILVDGDITKKLPKPNKDIIGLDLGIKDFIITSNNDRYENLRIKRNNEKKIARLHRKLSRKKKGSNNRKKSRVKLAIYYEKLNNRKENYLHHITNQLLDENQVIVIEDLNVQGMLKNKHLSKSLQELSLNRFKTMLEYKSQWYGRDLVKIDRWFPSSKLCSNCGHKNKELELKDRVWKCTNCNQEHDRDYNAALNIKNEGAKLYKDNIKIGHRMPESTPLESNPLGSQ